jgi:hypothetical protein
MIGLTLVTLVATTRVGTHRVVQQVGGRPVRGRLRDHSTTSRPSTTAAGGSDEGARVIAIGNVAPVQCAFLGATSATAVDPGTAQVIKMTWKEGS